MPTSSAFAITRKNGKTERLGEIAKAEHLNMALQAIREDCQFALQQGHETCLTCLDYRLDLGLLMLKCRARAKVQDRVMLYDGDTWEKIGRRGAKCGVWRDDS